MNDTTLSNADVIRATSYPFEKPSAAPLVAAGSAPSLAQARLDASRARLRIALMEMTQPPRPASSDGGLVDQLVGIVKGVPGISLLLEVAERWWQEHRGALQSAGEASQALVTPIARRYPSGLVGVSAAVGAILVLLRPWRLLLRPKVIFGAASLMATQALRSRSLTSWLQMATQLFAPSKKVPS